MHIAVQAPCYFLSLFTLNPCLDQFQLLLAGRPFDNGFAAWLLAWRQSRRLVTSFFAQASITGMKHSKESRRVAALKAAKTRADQRTTEADSAHNQRASHRLPPPSSPPNASPPHPRRRANTFYEDKGERWCRRSRRKVSESRAGSATCHAFRWGPASLKCIKIALISHIV